MQKKEKTHHHHYSHRAHHRSLDVVGSALAAQKASLYKVRLALVKQNGAFIIPPPSWGLFPRGFNLLYSQDEVFQSTPLGLIDFGRFWQRRVNNTTMLDASVEVKDLSNGRKYVELWMRSFRFFMIPPRSWGLFPRGFSLVYSKISSFKEPHQAWLILEDFDNDL